MLMGLVHHRMIVGEVLLLHGDGAGVLGYGHRVGGVRLVGYEADGGGVDGVHAHSIPSWDILLLGELGG